jgi:hypothetical protein
VPRMQAHAWLSVLFRIRTCGRGVRARAYAPVPSVSGAWHVFRSPFFLFTSDMRMDACLVDDVCTLLCVLSFSVCYSSSLSSTLILISFFSIHFLAWPFFILFIFIYFFYCLVVGGTRWRCWLRYCTTSRKVAGSIIYGIIGIFR